jgi:hypothetical protein
MGLLRGVARTAVVAGTATAVSNRVSRRQQGRWAAQEDQQQAAYNQQQQAYQQPPAYNQPTYEQPAQDPTEVRLARLKQLADLKASGVLTETEFEQQKAAILNS